MSSKKISDHNTVKAEINYRKKNGKKCKHMKTKQYATKKKNWSMKKFKKKTLRQMKWKYNFPKPTEFSRSRSKREFYNDTSLPYEKSKISNKPPNLTSKGIRKRRTKLKVSRRKEITKMREEVNKMDQK